ncbi:MAG: hypothetical protein LUD72_10685 [Bacteroidales bacterium]|nr:hypothetical protein [Bacteroidales bacterium]
METRSTDGCKATFGAMLHALVVTAIILPLAGSCTYTYEVGNITNGEKYSFTYYVTEQVDGAADPKHVHIVIDGMELPIAISNGDGFDPSVDDWQNRNHDIIM